MFFDNFSLPVSSLFYTSIAKTSSNPKCVNTTFFFQKFDQFCVMVDKSVRVNVAESMARRQWSTDEFSAVLSAQTEMVSMKKSS